MCTQSPHNRRLSAILEDMKQSFVISFIALAIPFVTFAQGDLLNLSSGLVGFINTFVIPTLLALAFAFFAFNILRYFIAESDDVSSRQNARDLAFYGITGFVIILIFWGLVRILTAGIGLGSDGMSAPVSDYFSGRGGTTNNTFGGQPTFSGPALEAERRNLSGTPIDTEALTNDALSGQTPFSGPTSGIEEEHLGTGPIDTDALTEAALNPPGGVDAIAAEAIAATISDSQSTIREAANSQLNSTVENLTDSSVSATITNDPNLFADLLQAEPSDSFNDLDRLRAAYRLNQLGVINNTEWQTYYDAINSRREQSFADSGARISLAEVQNTQTQPPTSIRNNLAPLQTELINTLDTYTTMNQEAIRSVVEEVFDPSLSTFERYEVAEDLVLSSQNQEALQFLRLLTSQTNAELIYSGEYALIID